MSLVTKSGRMRSEDGVILMPIGVLLQLMICAMELRADTLHFLSPVPLCGNRSELHLAPDGYESSRIITLDPSTDYDYCVLSVSAPSTHVIHMQFSEDLTRMKHQFHATMNPTCPLDMFLEQNMTPFWNGNLCASEPLPPVHMSQSKIILRWKSSFERSQTKGRKLIATAIGHGEICQRPGQHTCMKIDFNPVFCVAEELTCDGRENCPPGSATSDEGAFCDTGSLWHRRVMQVINRMPNVANTIRKSGHENSTDFPKVLHNLEKTFNNFKRLSRIETTTQPVSEASTFGTLHDLLSQYDPWGYLCLGIVLCGSLLLICCGLWECCIRRYKTDALSNNHDPPTAVLVLNGGEDAGVGNLQGQRQQQSPPNYDELDLPPSYGALFPNKPPDDHITRSEIVGEVIPLDSITQHDNRDEPSSPSTD